MIKIAHRGASGYEPENTLRAFQKALDMKADMVELDVYVCKSGELVVIHDDKVNRTTNGNGYVVEKTLSELRELDAGKGEKIPTLHEVLHLIDGKAKINIELKGTGTAASVHALLSDAIADGPWTAKDFIVSSFDHYELRDFRALNQHVPIGALISGIPIGYAEFADKIGADYVNLDKDFINEAFIADAHQRGMSVFAWTVNDPDDITHIKKLGVDGIFSNYPDLL